MPTEFDIAYPNKERLNFAGGLNNKYERALIQNDESPDCLNVICTEGSVETRGGSTKVNTTSVGTFVGDGVYTRNDSDGSQTMCAWWNGTMYTLGTTTFTTIPSAQSVYTAGIRVACAEYENHLFFGKGNSAIPYKYNGTDFTRHGVYSPTTAPTATSQNTGVITGDYRWKVTFVNSQVVEGDTSDATSTYAAASATMRVTIPTAPQSWGVDARNVYRTVSSGTTFFLVDTVSDNSTTTYDDNSADTDLGTEAPTDNGVPPSYNAIVYHQDRLFMNDPGNPNLIWYTNLAEPYTVASTNFLRAGDASGDIVRGFDVFDNNIVVFCDNSQWILYMPDTDASNWQMVRVKSNFGSKSPFGSFKYRNKIMFPAMQNNKLVGFSAISGNAIEPSASLLTIGAIGSEVKSNRIDPDIELIQEGYIKNISSFVYRNKAYITVTYGTSQTTNNRIYVFDFSLQDYLSKNKEGSWYPWTGINATQFCEYDGKLYIQDSEATGFVRQILTSSYNDDGNAINSYFWTKEYSGQPGHEDWHKDFRKLKFFYEKSGAWYMDLIYRVDSDKGAGNVIQINLDPGGSLWGTMRWGIDDWGGGSDEGEEELCFGQTRGKRIQFKFSNQNTADQKFKVLGLRYIYNLKGRR